MQVVIHAGAHTTDENRLVHCLIKNRDMLNEIGTNVPSTGDYHKLIRDVMQTALKTGIADDARDLVLGSVLQGNAIDRLVLSNSGFFGTPKMVTGQEGQLYSASVERLDILRRLFSYDETELFFAICNPATFLPALFDKVPITDFNNFMRGSDPKQVRWSELLSRLRAEFPDLPITVWCNEDLPLIWGEVIRQMAGLDPTAAFEGEFALLDEIMSETGMKRFHAYMASHPGMSETQKRRVIAAFLDKFARDEAIEEELDIPGWTDELIEELTELYDEDLFVIQSLPGINLITP